MSAVACNILRNVARASCDKKINVKLDFIVEDELYASITTSGGDSIEMPADPEKSGFVFDGWYDGEGGTGTQYTDATGAGVRTWDKETDTVLYAKWEEIAVSAT